MLAELASALAPEDVQLFYQIAITGRRDLPLAPDPRTGFEMTLLRMIAFRPAGEPGTAHTPGATRCAAQRARGTQARHARERCCKRGRPGENPGRSLGGDREPARALGRGAPAREPLQFVGRQGAVVRLALDAHNQPMRTPAQEDKLAQALSRHYGEPVRLEFQSLPAGGETPALLAQRASEQELASARRAFDSDPGVQGLRERFGATVLPDTVRPVK